MGNQLNEDLGGEDIKVIHIIGFVGAGKTTFIRKYLNEHLLFDIKDVYEHFQFEPQDLMKDPIKYRQFEEAINFTLEKMINTLKSQRLKEGQSPAFLVIESSGTNRAVNEFVKKYPHLTIWVESDFYKDRNILKTRKYASGLNKYLENRLKNHELQFDFIFDVNEKKFKKNLLNKMAENNMQVQGFSSSYNLLFKEESESNKGLVKKDVKEHNGINKNKSTTKEGSIRKGSNYDEFLEEFKIAFKGLPQSAFK